ncbi:MAG: chromosomal replication initiator protein DnaA [Chloroflexi bacterium]|nr:chromosomal replication initiator protein DnaA [Chloroflexota bacterium]
MTIDTKNAKDIWAAALGQIQLCVNKNSFDTWFKETQGITVGNGIFTIGVANSFILENLQKHQQVLSESVLSQILKENVHAKFVLKSATNVMSVAVKTKDDEFTFERFIVGEQNRQAVATALSIASHPGQSYNPFIIYGKVGLGKTHLLHAIDHMAKQEGYKTVFVTSERFTNEFVAALRDKKTEEFNQKYRSVDILLIDDIQFIGGKTQTEDNFFHTFNELRSSGKQLVITSNCHPRDIAEVDARLRSRFEWGLSVEIMPPDEKNRANIIRALLIDNNLSVDEEVVSYLSAKPATSVRELIGSFNKVTAHCRLKRCPLNINNAKTALGETIKARIYDTTGQNSDSIRILQIIAEISGVSIEDIQSSKRNKNISFARRCAVYFLKTTLNISLADIGKIMGGKSPSSISQNLEKTNQEIQNNIYTKRKITEIRNKII